MVLTSKLKLRCAAVAMSGTVTLQVTALALIILSALTTSWLFKDTDLSNTSLLKGDNYGLWRYCISDPAITPRCAYIEGFPEWWNASRSFILMSGIVSMMAIIAYFTTAFDLFPGERGRTTFMGATASFAESSFLVVSLCIFVAKSSAAYEAFNVGYSYYLAWAAFVANLGSLACVLAFFFLRPEPDKEPIKNSEDAESNYTLLPNSNNISITELPSGINFAQNAPRRPIQRQLVNQHGGETSTNHKLEYTHHSATTVFMHPNNTTVSPQQQQQHNNIRVEYTPNINQQYQIGLLQTTLPKLY